MPDIRLVQNTLFPNHPHYAVTIDWSLLDDGTLDETQALATAIIVALGTNKLANVTDILPDLDSTDRCGWWGDLDAEELWDGWPIGNRLWLLRRDKITESGAQRGATVVWVEQYIREAIKPFIENRIGSSMKVEASRIGKERIDALVRIYRGPVMEIELQYQILWSEIYEGKAGFLGT
jgi:phage gp46-like protein